MDQQRTLGDKDIAAFFFPKEVKKAILPNGQRLDASGLRGRLLSSSYTRVQGDTAYQPMLVALDELFARYQEGGWVRFLPNVDLLWLHLKSTCPQFVVKSDTPSEGNNTWQVYNAAWS